MYHLITQVLVERLRRCFIDQFCTQISNFVLVLELLPPLKHGPAALKKEIQLAGLCPEESHPFEAA